MKIFLYLLAERLFGKRWVKYNYLKYSVRKFKKEKIIFIHIPRTGGTSISKAIFGKRNGHFSALELRNYFGPVYFESVFSFAVVRNPFDRLQSAYQFIKSNGSKHGAIRPNKVYASKAFETFENFIKKWLVFQPHESIDLLFRPQYLFVTDNHGSLIVKKIFQIENLEEIIVEIGAIVKRPLSIGKFNSTNSIHFTNYYNDELAELVFNYYKKDFLLFNYSRQLSAKT